MRIAIPKVHGDSPKEKAIRTIALLLVFAAVMWAFTKNNERVVDALNRQSSVYDETGTLDDDQRKFIASFTKSLRDEFGLSSQIQIFETAMEIPELDAKTLYIGLVPTMGEVELRFPGLVRTAVGQEFIDGLKTDYFLPSFERGDWPQELQIVLATIFDRLVRLETGEAAGE